MAADRHGRAKSDGRAGFELERRSGLRDPDNRLDWATDFVAYANRYREHRASWTVGSLSVAPTRYEDDIATELQFRSEPLARCGGAEFRFQIAHGNRLGHNNAILHHLVEAERRLVADESDTARTVNQVSDMASELIEALGRDQDSAVAVTAIGCVFGIRMPMRLQVEAEVLGHDLVAGIHRVDSASLFELEYAMHDLMLAHARRHEMQTGLHRQGARARIATTVPLMLEQAGMSLAFALERLTRRRELAFRFGKGRRIHARLSWEESVLEGSFHQPDLGLAFAMNELTIRRRGLPETALAALPGRRLDALIEHACLPADATITSARSHDGYDARIVVRLQPGSSLPLLGPLDSRARR